ncbi:MAG: hypothetical protein AMQ22_02170 [Candidatus Methanofastidiosum methylothiophilum]|uniref:Methyltransferase domain-containing protein n=1 Tax=Candidatus Methanofastidiosum methylothiophilum TaxID=1705564 RepID=A0A150IN62_9EURY|nr:MAG: hypothetical protein AMQ22_02170 [Candidatus Methanofastidiosum methylthiophilus]
MNNSVFSTRAVSVYKALFFSEYYSVSKKAIDCGAGGNNPPIQIFEKNGYKTVGIDIDENQIAQANRVFMEKEYRTRILKDDFRCIHQADNEFGCSYSYNSVFHMKKEDVKKSIMEMIRITEPGGVIYFNLLHKNDCGYGNGKRIDNDSFEDLNDGIIHSYYLDDEIDKDVNNCELLEKEIKNVQRQYENRIIHQWFIEYFYRKNGAT